MYVDTEVPDNAVVDRISAYRPA